MKPKISEFSYGYALTENLGDWVGSPLVAAPVFPSLIEEGKADGGYDLKLQFGSVPLFLQFKLSDIMKGRRAVECRDYGLFSPPFYRMNLHPLKRSKQHSLLLDLEQKGNLVYYAAPAFHEIEQINRFYIDREIVARSIYIRPSAIGPLPDDKPHHVAFKLGGSSLPLSVTAYRFSEPTQLAIDTASNMLEELSTRLHQRERHNMPLSELFSGLLHEMTGILEEHLDFVDRSHLSHADFGGPLRSVAYLSRMYFSCELFLVRPRPQDS